MSIQTNYQKLLNEVKKINPNAEICVVTKTQPIEKILEAIDAGAKIIGENRIQEAEEKFPSLPSSVEKHLIGHLQRNKVKKAVQLFNVIQSVDSLRLAKKINRECEKINKIMPIMLEVNTSSEEQKYGFLPEEVLENATKIQELKNLETIGLMTVAKYETNPENCRPSFQQLQTLYSKLSTLRHLSMGMTNDYKIALEAGSSLVRVGTRIFGKRI